MKTLYNTQTKQFVAYPRKDSEPVVGLHADFIIVDVVNEPQPDYDAATHVLKSVSSFDEQAKILINSWSIEPKSIEQINEQLLIGEINQGFLVQPENFTLALHEKDRNAFTQMLSLIQEALSLGLTNNDAIVVIADQSGAKHSVTTLRFRQIMVGYGLYYKSLWDKYTK